MYGSIIWDAYNLVLFIYQIAESRRRGNELDELAAVEKDARTDHLRLLYS